MRRKESTNNRHHAVGHRTQVSGRNDDSAVQMTRVLTCYAYEKTMVVDVNPEMVDFTAVNNNGHTHYQDAQLHRASRGTYTSSQTAADERSKAMYCYNQQHADSEQKSRNRHFMHSSHRTDLNNPISKERHCNSNRKHNHESHHNKTVNHNKQHIPSYMDDPYGKLLAHREKHKACRHHPKETTTYSSATSENINELQVNVEFEVDSSLSTCAAIQNVDIEGVVDVNATVCQPPKSKDVKGSSHGAVGGHHCHKRIERKSKTADEMNELDVCIESNVRITYKENDTNTRRVATHRENHHGERSSKHVTKNGQEIPVGTSASPTTDKSLTLNSELQLLFEFVQDKTNTLTDMKECCGTIRDEITAFQDTVDRLNVVRNKVDQMYFKMDQRNFNSDNTFPNLKSRNIFQGYEKTVIVKTKRNCSGKCNECNPTIQKYANVKSLQEKKYWSEPVLKQCCLKNEGDTLPQSASDYWNRGKDITDRDVGIRNYCDCESDCDRRESMSEREAGIRDSASSSWYIENHVPVEQDFAPVDHVSVEVDVGLKYSTSNGLVTDEKPFDKMCPSSQNLREEESLSVEDDGEKYSSATSGDGRDNMPDRNIETKEFTSNGWNINESIPEEEGIGVVDPLPDDWDSQEYNTDENDLEAEAPVSGDLSPEQSVHNDRDPALHDFTDTNSHKNKPHVVTKKHVLIDENKDNTVQADKNSVKKDPVLKTSNKGESTSTHDSGKMSIVDTVVDYLKRGIFLSHEDKNMYRRRNILSRRIGRDVLTDVGGIDASYIFNEDKDKGRLVSDNRDGVNYEVLDRVPSFRSTLDETTTMVSQQHMDRLWNHGHTTVYLGDRVSYFEIPSNDKELTESAPSTSENVQPISPRNNMLDEVSAILKQIDTPYISQVGSNIRNQSDIRSMPSSSRSAEYGANICSLGNFVPEGEFGMDYRRKQPTIVSDATSSNAGASKEVEKTSFLQTIYGALGALKPRCNVNQTSGASTFNETVSPSLDKSETIGSTAGDKSVQIPEVNCSNKMPVNFMNMRENFGRRFTYGNERQYFENGSHTGDNNVFPNDGSQSIGNTNVPIEEGKPTVDSSNKRSRTREVNLDNELNTPSRNCEPNDIVVNSETIGLKTRRSKRKNPSSVNINESVTDDDSQSISSGECLSISDAESDVNDQQAASTIDAGTKEESVPFQGIRGYPTRLYPITLYCLCVLLLYLFWTACYFNCTYTSYGIARRSKAWYCRLYRAVKDTDNYTPAPEIRKVGYGKLFHPFRPW